MDIPSELLIDTVTASMRIFLPYQQRVIAERGQVKDRLTKLHAFICSEACMDLAAEERDRLARQAAIMGLYADVLSERIYAFLPKCDP